MTSKKSFFRSVFFYHLTLQFWLPLSWIRTCSVYSASDKLPALYERHWSHWSFFGLRSSIFIWWNTSVNSWRDGIVTLLALLTCLKDLVTRVESFHGWDVLEQMATMFALVRCSCYSVKKWLALFHDFLGWKSLVTNLQSNKNESRELQLHATLRPVTSLQRPEGQNC